LQCLGQGPSPAWPCAIQARQLLPNGKVSRKTLPAPEWGAEAPENYVAPSTDVEAKLQAVWQEVLGRGRVSAQADFFSIGGNSLQACAA